MPRISYAPGMVRISSGVWPMMATSSPGTMSPSGPMVPAMRPGNRLPSWSSGTVGSSLASAGETSFSPGPGNRCTPGGTGGCGPNGAMWTRMMSRPAYRSVTASHRAWSGAVGGLSAVVRCQARRSMWLCMTGKADSASRISGSPIATPMAISAIRAMLSRPPANAMRIPSRMLMAFTMH